MVKIEFYPVGFGYKPTDEGVLLQLYGRNPEGHQLCVQLSGLEPYLYAYSESLSPEELAARISSLYIQRKDLPVRITRTEIVEKRYLGKKLRCVKTFTLYPGDLQLIRASIETRIEGTKVFGSDEIFIHKFLVSNMITPLVLTEAEGDFVNQRSKVPFFEAKSLAQNSTSILENPKILAIDLEAERPKGKPSNPEENQIIMISFAAEGFSKTLISRKFETDDPLIESVEGEAELLRRFVEIIQEIKPDILAGYYSDSFDLPFIVRRAEKHRIRLDLGLDYSLPEVERGTETSTSIRGITHLDLSKFIRKTLSTSIKTPSHSLSAVARELLSTTREDLSKEDLTRAYTSGSRDIMRFCTYNQEGARLIRSLSLALLPNLLELVKLTGLPIYDLSRMGYSQLAESYLLLRLKEINELVPPLPSKAEIEKRKLDSYQGAFVYQPEPGLYRDIAVFDFRSLYPSIITSHNISLDTLNCDCCKGKANVPGEQHWFCKNKKGIMASVVDELISRRLRIKELIKSGESTPVLKAREQALKTIANSVYGYLGFYLARWYCKECVESISSYGRYYITSLIEKSEKEGYRVLYSDTDSVFMALQEKTLKDAGDFMGLFNMSLPEQMELEYGGFYPRGIFVSTKLGETGAKKRYALLTDEGSLIIKGFETVRRNTSAIARRVQQKLLEIILKEDDPKKAVEYVRDIIKKIRDRRILVEEMIIFTELQKKVEDYETIGPHVAVARRLQERGNQIGPGSIIGYIICGAGELVRDKAKLPDECSIDDYDVDYYVNNQIIPSVEKILEVIGYTKEDILSDADQEKLDRFFK